MAPPMIIGPVIPADEAAGDTARVLLFHPPSHERLTTEQWNESRAVEAIAHIVEDTEAAFDENRLWAMHPLDQEEKPEPPLACSWSGEIALPTELQLTHW